MREAAASEILATFAIIGFLSVGAAVFLIVLSASIISKTQKRVWRLGPDWHERRRARLSHERK